MFLKEIGYAVRQLQKTPGFTLVAVLTLALGIGGSTAVFTVVDSVVLKSLSYRNSGQLVVLWERVKFLGSGYTGPNSRHALIWQDRAGAFSGLALLGQGAGGVTLGAAEHPRLVGIVRAAPNLLDVLEVTPLLGHNFRPEDAVKSHENVAILTYQLWRQSLFYADPTVIGKTVRVGDVPQEVIGVLPQSFHFPKRNVLSAGLQPKSRGETQEVEVLLPAVIDRSHSFGWNSVLR